MINLNYKQYYKDIRCFVFEKKMVSEISIKPSAGLFFRIIASELIITCFASISYFNGKGEVEMGSLIFFFLLPSCFIIIPLFKKSKIVIFPFANAFEILSFWNGEKIKWPYGYKLDYETNYSSNNEVEAIKFFAISEDKGKIISIYTFDTIETFEKFKDIYNSNFLNNKIRE